MDDISQEDNRAAQASTVEQPIGTRHPITVPISWVPEAKSRWRSAGKPSSVMSSAWSLLGLEFEDVKRDDVTVPGPIVITIGEVQGTAILRRTEPGETEGSQIYVVDFDGTDLEKVARDLISIHLARDPSARPSRREMPGAPTPYEPNYDDWY